MKEEGISRYRMAKDLGIAYESLFRSLKEDANPEWKRIKQILEYLGYEITLRPRRKKSQKTSKTSRSRGQKGE